MPRQWTLPTWPFHVTSPFLGIYAAPQRPSCRWTAGRESTNMSGQCGEANLSLLRYHALIPAPTNERQALEREREELPREPRAAGGPPGVRGAGAARATAGRARAVPHQPAAPG